MLGLSRPPTPLLLSLIPWYRLPPPTPPSLVSIHWSRCCSAADSVVVTNPSVPQVSRLFLFLRWRLRRRCQSFGSIFPRICLRCHHWFLGLVVAPPPPPSSLPIPRARHIFLFLRQRICWRHWFLGPVLLCCRLRRRYKFLGTVIAPLPPSLSLSIPWGHCIFPLLGRRLRRCCQLFGPVFLRLRFRHCCWFIRPVVAPLPPLSLTPIPWARRLFLFLHQRLCRHRQFFGAVFLCLRFRRCHQFFEPVVAPMLPLSSPLILKEHRIFLFLFLGRRLCCRCQFLWPVFLCLKLGCCCWCLGPVVAPPPPP